MKKIFLLALAAFTLFACSEDEVVKNTDDQGAVAAILINVQGGALSGRAVEEGHPGATGTKLSPVVRTVDVLAYSDQNVLIGTITLDESQMKSALYGDYTLPDGSEATAVKPAGAKVGLPKGTKYVDVIVNQYANNTDGTTNINFFNYRDGQDKDGNSYGTGLETTFARTPLLASDGKKIELSSDKLVGGTGTGGVIPEYEVDFSVSPGFARFEVHGGINVKAPEVYKNYYGNRWYTTTVKDFITAVQSLNSVNSNIQKLDDLKAANVVDTDGAVLLYTGTANSSDQIVYYGAMIANAKNGFGPNVASSNDITDNSTVYLPEYFWAYKGTVPSKPKPISENKISNGNTASTITELSETKTWIKNAGFPVDGSSNIVSWNPNIYYAVDVEEIYINNIKVVSSSASPFMHQWPGSEAATHWPDWYKAYHLHGWHTAGKSSDNTFYCMGNMWDRISATNSTNSQDLTLDHVPDVTGGGNLTMPVITRKAIKIDGISKYYDTDRNLGVADNKAAGYVVYPQSTTIADTEANKDNLGNALPHIIVKLKAYRTEDNYTNGTYVSGKEFITLKLFKGVDASNNVGDHIRNFQMSNIYRLDLNDITKALQPGPQVPNGVNPGPNGPDDPNPGVPTDPIDPDPEMPGISLDLTIKVLQWTIQNITPDI